MSDDRTTIVTADRGGSGGWAVAVVLLLLIIAGLVFFGGFNFLGAGKGGSDINVNVEVPKLPAAGGDGG